MPHDARDPAPTDPDNTQPNPGYHILIELRDFARARTLVALVGALIAALVGWVAASSTFAGVDCVPLYAGFKEWDPDYGPVTAQCIEGISPCQCEIKLVTSDAATGHRSLSEHFRAPLRPFKSLLRTHLGFFNPREPRPGPMTETLSEHFRARRESFMRYIDDFVRVDDARDVAGLARFVSVIMSGVLGVVVYRGLLDEGYAAKLKRAQFNEIKAMKQSLVHVFSGLAMVFPTCMIAYVVLTAIWLLLADMFEALAMRSGGAMLFTTLSAGLVGFVVSYLMSVLSTRHLLAMGMVVFIVGMTAAFATAGQVLREEGMKFWWQTAISSLGEEPGTDVLFLYVFVALFIIFVVLWFDMADFLRDVLAASRWPLNWGVFHGPARLLRQVFGRRFTFFNGLAAFYFLAALGLLSAGIFPLVSYGSRSVYILTLTLHSGGALAAMAIYWLGGMVLVTIRLSGVVFRWRFIVLTVFTFGGIIVAAYLFVIGVLNMTAIELIGFALCGIWLYAAIDNLLQYSNLKAQKADSHTAHGHYPAHPIAEKILGQQQELFNQPILRRGTGGPASSPEQ